MQKINSASVSTIVVTQTDGMTKADASGFMLVLMLMVFLILTLNSDADTICNMQYMQYADAI